MSKRKKEIDSEIVVLYCAQSVGEKAKSPVEKTEGVSFVMMPCSSKVEGYQVLEILAGGANGVEVVACPAKACKHMVGNDRAEKRMGRIKKLLDEIGVGADRAGITRGSKFTMKDLLGIASKRREAVKSLGPNPMRGE